jgi:hypothetical protein
MCTALEKADEATATALREAYVAANATTPEGAAAVGKVREIFGKLEIESAYLVRVEPASQPASQPLRSSRVLSAATVAFCFLSLGAHSCDASNKRE